MTAIQVICLVLSLVCSAYVLKNTNLNQLASDKAFQHKLFGAMTALFVLWLFRVSIYDGLVMHFMALTALTLMLGFRWSVIASFVVLLGSTIIGQESWVMFGVNALVGVLIPIALTYGVFMFTFHRVPRGLFVYVFLCAFFPGALSMLAKMLIMSGYYWLDGAYSWDVISYNYTQMTILMLFPEAFFNGMIMTCLIVYKPDLVYTFHDKFYLDGK